MTLWEKMRTIAQRIYGADDISADKRVMNQFEDAENGGFGHYPVCVAKSQYSLSADPTLKGAEDSSRTHSAMELHYPVGNICSQFRFPRPQFFQSGLSYRGAEKLGRSYWCSARWKSR